MYLNMTYHSCTTTELEVVLQYFFGLQRDGSPLNQFCHLTKRVYPTSFNLCIGITYSNTSFDEFKNHTNEGLQYEVHLNVGVWMWVGV